MEPYTGIHRDGTQTKNLHSITVNYPGKPPRRFTGTLIDRTWESDPQPCLYAGDLQGGASDEVKDNDPVIEGTYSEYQVNDAFATNFIYSHFDESKCKLE